MLSNHFGETLQKPNAEQRFPRLQRYTRITNARLTSDNVKITERVEKILAPKFSLKNKIPSASTASSTCYTPKAIEVRDS